ncbi:MAG TPA: DUF1801 domain-containing protein [Candidatus Saccharimonadaceae bacterium]|nr:DUF1801 domain-containing protein [Candidatus Saccharimonadaceae bacterium]
MTQDSSASQEIDAIIAKSDDWRGEMLARLRQVILAADPQIEEMVKWKKPSKPEGVAVWFFNGNLCMVDILKSAVRINFVKGIKIPDPKKLFNARLDSSGIRAIDFFEGNTVDEAGLAALVCEAAELNRSKDHRA